MKRIAFVVEGQTEEFFVNSILKGELANAELKVVNVKGDYSSVPAMLRHIKPLLYAKFFCITTMVDFYGFRNPGRKSSAEDIERGLADAVKDNNRGDTLFLPYVQKHEFEALLFSDRQAIADHLQPDGKKLKQLKNTTAKPEDINHDMPPSKQIRKIYSDYDKLVDGIAIIEKIGLARVEKECPKFAEWIGRLRKIAKE